jgi:acetyl esterase/lipase
MASGALRAIIDVARHLPAVRRDPLGALDLLTPRTGVRMLTNVAYGPHGGQVADLYLPETDEAPLSAVVFFHGGRWSYGCKEEYRFVGHALASRGHAALVCDYRKYPSVRFPAFVDDAAAATAFSMRHLPGHGVVPNRIFLMGHSAGAHLAALATLDRRYGDAHGYDPDGLAGLVLMSGPFDFYPIRGADLRDIFGPEEGHIDTQPMRFVRRGLPPMLFLHGRRDRTVSPSSSARMASALRDRGCRTSAIFYDRVTHTSILGGLSGQVGMLVGPVLGDVASFLDRRSREVG